MPSVRKLPLDAKLVERIRSIGEGKEWVFRSEAFTPNKPRHALKRYVRPAAKSLGIVFGGWHDFRHPLSTTLRRSGVHPKVMSDILGHKKVNLAMDVYDRLILGISRSRWRPWSTVGYPMLPNRSQRHEKVSTVWGFGRRGRNRTCNPRIRNPMLYPFELRARSLFTRVSAISLTAALLARSFSFEIARARAPIAASTFGSRSLM